MSKYNILDFGAKPGELCTKSIQAALDAADRDGGGTVVIPSGTYISGTINLGSSSLKLEKGAVLKGSPKGAYCELPKLYDRLIPRFLPIQPG